MPIQNRPFIGLRIVRLDFKKDLLKTAGIKSPVKDTLLALTEENEHIHPWKQHSGIRSCE
jgi:hypothetical protein